MSVILKLSAVAIIYVLLSVILKSYLSEYAFLLRVFTAVLIFALIIDDVASFIEIWLKEFSILRIESIHIDLILKVIAISILCDFVSDALKDVGENAIANIVIISSKFVILLIAFPLFEGIIIFCSEFLR